MAFENLGEKLQSVFKGLRSKGKLTESDIKTAMREVKLALLEADVNFKVVKDFIKNVSEKAMDTKVLESLTPGQSVIKIVRDELTVLMGSENEHAGKDIYRQQKNKNRSTSKEFIQVAIYPAVQRPCKGHNHAHNGDACAVNIAGQHAANISKARNRSTPHSKAMEQRTQGKDIRILHKYAE